MHAYFTTPKMLLSYIHVAPKEAIEMEGIQVEMVAQMLVPLWL